MRDLWYTRSDSLFTLVYLLSPNYPRTWLFLVCAILGTSSDFCTERVLAGSKISLGFRESYMVAAVTQRPKFNYKFQLHSTLLTLMTGLGGRNDFNSIGVPLALTKKSLPGKSALSCTV